MPAKGVHMPVSRWDAAKVGRFIRAWNDGVLLYDLAERFGLKNPSSMAQTLRKRGHALTIRRSERDDA